MTLILIWILAAIFNAGIFIATDALDDCVDWVDCTILALMVLSGPIAASLLLGARLGLSFD